MNYLKRFNENFNKEILDKISDIFIDFEDDKWVVKSYYGEIVPDRDDWTGNFRSTKVRSIYGDKFIDYHAGVIMFKDDEEWISKKATIVTLSKIHYLKYLDESTINKHWKDLDRSIVSKIETIKKRADNLNLHLYGVHGKWFEMGKALHSDYEGEEYYGYDMSIDVISFAFF